tara:strand:+ start:58 stop:1194 length:1137 start_codon:yes stop_codon:yes gene_type:complete
MDGSLSIELLLHIFGFCPLNPSDYGNFRSVSKAWYDACNLYYEESRRLQLAFRLYHGVSDSKMIVPTGRRLSTTKEDMIGQVRCNKILTLSGGSIRVAAKGTILPCYPWVTDFPNPKPDDLHGICSAKDGTIYGIGLRSLWELPAKTRFPDKHFVDTPASNVNVMCVGLTVFVSTTLGVVATRGFLGDQTRTLVTNEKNHKHWIVSPLSNHDPEAEYGATLVFGTNTLLQIFDSMAIVAASKNISCGDKVHTFVGVAISKDGSKVCVETFANNTSTIIVYRVDYGPDVFHSTIDEIGSFKCNRNAKKPCRDIVIVGDYIVAVEASGRMKAWWHTTCTFDWELDCNKNEHGQALVDAVAISGDKLAFLTGENVSVFSVC